MEGYKKALIFFAAYNAGKLIVKILKRIPSNIYKNYPYGILTRDDKSIDNTFNMNVKILYIFIFAR